MVLLLSMEKRVSRVSRVMSTPAGLGQWRRRIRGTRGGWES